MYKKNYLSKNIPDKLKKIQSKKKKTPYVLIQLPVYNEETTILQLLDAIFKLDYPENKLYIQILDDSQDNTSKTIQTFLANKDTNQYLNFEYIYRTSREEFKAGALKLGLEKLKNWEVKNNDAHQANKEKTHIDIVAIFDTDFIPSPSFLHSTVCFFDDPDINIVQTRWSYYNANTSYLTKIQKILLDAHFQIEHTARCYSNCFIHFNGTAGLLRISSILKANNWYGDTLTEDLDLSYRLNLIGSKNIHLPFVECQSELPNNMQAFKSQQFRWTKGTLQVAKKLLAPILQHKSLSWKTKLEAFVHLTSPCLYLFSFILLALMPFRIFVFPSYEFFPFIKLIDMSIYMVAVSLNLFYHLYAQKEIYHSWKIAFSRLKLNLFIIGNVLLVYHLKALFEFLINKKTAFIRTPKKGYNIPNNINHLKQKSTLKNYLFWFEFCIMLYTNFFIGFLLYLEYWFSGFLLLIIFLGYNYNILLYFKLSSKTKRNINAISR